MYSLMNTLSGKRATRAIAKEGEDHIEQAEDLVKNNQSTDPTVLQEADDFNKEIKALKAEHDQDGTSPDPDPSVSPDQAGEEGSGDAAPSEDSGDAPVSEDGAQEGDGGGQEEGSLGKDKADITEEDKEKADKEIQAADDDAKGGAPDVEEAASADTGSAKVEAALESLSLVGAQCQHLSYAHETGVVRAWHKRIAQSTVNGAAARFGLERVSFAKESAGGIVQSIAKFVANLIASIKAFFANIFKWIADLLRGFHARKGKYEQSETGVKDRIKSLKDTKAAIAQNGADETAEISKLANYHGNDFAAIAKAVEDVRMVQKVLVEQVASQQLADLFLSNMNNIILGMMNNNPVQGVEAALANVIAVDEKIAFGIRGASSAFGIAPFWRDNLHVQASSSNTFSKNVVLKNLIGGNAIQWTVQESSGANVQDYASALRALECTKTVNASSNSKIRLLSSVEEIERLYVYRKDLIAQTEKLLELTKTCSIFSNKMVDVSKRALDSIAKAGPAMNLDPTFAANVAVVFGASPEGYNRLATASLAAIAAIFTSVCDGLDELARQSMAAIDKKMVLSKAA